MTTAPTTNTIVTTDETEPQTSQSQLKQFDKWFLRCRDRLEYTASLILPDPKMARSAVQNCWLKACRNPPACESEGAFRSWLLRRLIHEALHVLHQTQVGKKTPLRFARSKSTLPASFA
jgi:DNA-directed RNA polymerase specialized sigma24 family protein